MSEMWKQWVGRTVDGRFPLQSYLGGSDHCAVFLTSRQSPTGDVQSLAVKLIAAVPADADGQLLRWKAASDLSHPNLIQIFESGRCEFDGLPLLYVVQEYAEENLAQILPERSLTPEEARGMLPPILRALQFVHDKGFVHGHIQPSNILAMGDQIKVASDTLVAPGAIHGAERAYDPPEAATAPISKAADIWQLGMTIVEVMTQRLPVWDRVRAASATASASPTSVQEMPAGEISAPIIPMTLPEPFRAIAARCLQLDPGNRPTTVEIIAGLETGRLYAERLMPKSGPSENAGSTPDIPSSHKISAKWSYLLGVAAIAAIVFVFIPRPKPSALPAQSQAVQAPPSTTPEKSEPSPAATIPAAPAHNSSTEVVHRVMPQVSPGAQRTIHGKIKVRVRVDVDAAGNVQKAKLESSGPSRYFSRLAMDAARDWKFSPAAAGDQPAVRKWKLEFAFTRSNTEASAVPTNNK